MTSKQIKPLTILITLFLILAVLVIYALTNTQSGTKHVSAQSNEPTIIAENGYKVIQDNDPNRQTILATVVSKTPDGKYFTAVNNYDSSDTVVIDGNFAKGDKVSITFFHDDVEKVEVLERETF